LLAPLPWLATCPSCLGNFRVYQYPPFMMQSADGRCWATCLNNIFNYIPSPSPSPSWGLHSNFSSCDRNPSNSAGRSLSLLDPTYASKYIPIIASVSEHQPPSWSSYFTDLHITTLLAPAGLLACFRCAWAGFFFVQVGYCVCVCLLGCVGRARGARGGGGALLLLCVVVGGWMGGSVSGVVDGWGAGCRYVCQCGAPFWSCCLLRRSRSHWPPCGGLAAAGCWHQFFWWWGGWVCVCGGGGGLAWHGMAGEGMRAAGCLHAREPARMVEQA
jgi:hypothetical protein